MLVFRLWLLEVVGHHDNFNCVILLAFTVLAGQHNLA